MTDLLIWLASCACGYVLAQHPSYSTCVEQRDRIAIERTAAGYRGGYVAACVMDKKGRKK